MDILTPLAKYTLYFPNLAYSKVKIMPVKAMSMPAHSLTLSWVKEATPHYVYAERMREVISLALVSGENIIFSGPGGQGKSEFIADVLSAIKDAEPFVKSLGQGTSMEELFGGIDLKQFNDPDSPLIQYNTDNSFLPHRLAVLEELFDAPPKVLTALKDVLTARELRNGKQRVEMETAVIMAATNMSPTDLASQDRSVAALVERFALQLEVKWPSYTEDDYMLLAQAPERPGEMPVVSWTDIETLQNAVSDVQVGAAVMRTLAYVASELNKQNTRISPRIFNKTVRLIRAAAVINHRMIASFDDLRVVTYLPGCQEKAEMILELIADKREELEILEQLEFLEESVAEFSVRCDEATTLDQVSRLSDELHNGLRPLVRGLKVGHTLGNRLYKIMETMKDLADRLAEQEEVMHERKEQEANDKRLLEIEKRRILLSNKLRACRTMDDVGMIEQEIQRLLDEVLVLQTSVNPLRDRQAHDLHSNLSRLMGSCQQRRGKLRSNNNGWVRR